MKLVEEPLVANFAAQTLRGEQWASAPNPVGGNPHGLVADAISSAFGPLSLTGRQLDL